MVAEPSRGPCMGEEPLKWIVICPTDDHCMISDEFESFCLGQGFFCCCIYMPLNLDIGQLAFFLTWGPVSDVQRAHFRGDII